MLRLKGKRVKLGRWSVSAGALVITSLVLAGGGATYAALQLGNSDAQSVNLQSGLAGWWKMDGNGNDSSGNGNNVTSSNVSLTSDRKGVASRAYEFAGGTNSYMSGPTGTTGSTLSFTTNFSLSAWVKPTSYHTTGYFGLKNGVITRGPATTFNYALQITDATTVSFIKRTGAEGIQYYNFTSPSLTNQWSSVTATVNGSALRMYVNGNLIGTATVGAIAPGASDPFMIGTNAAGNTEGHFLGSIDDVRVYNRTINDAEAKALYSESSSYVKLASGQKGLIGWWKLDGNGKDSTPYENTGIITGGTTASDRKGAAGAAYSFNASASKMVLANVVGQSGQMTASVWYKRNEANSSTSWRTILGHKTGNIHQLILNNTSRNLGIFDGSYRDFGYTVPNDSSWHNFTVIYDSAGTARLYVDGSFVSQVTTTLNLATNPIGTIGNWATGSYWAGDIDEVKIYNRALTDPEILRGYQSYNSQINLNSSPTASSTTGNINTGLIGYWPFSGNAKDATPYANNGAVTNATLTTDRKGRTDRAYLFNGTSANITGNLIGAVTKAGNYTVSAWVKPNSTTADQTIWQNSANCSDRNGMGVGSGQARFNYFDGTAYTSKRGPIAAGVWTHLVGINSGGVLSLYINGVSQSSIGNIYVHCSVGLWVGSTSSIPTTPNWFDGSIDELRVYNRALTATEVQALYSQ